MRTAAHGWFRFQPQGHAWCFVTNYWGKKNSWGLASKKHGAWIGLHKNDQGTKGTFEPKDWHIGSIGRISEMTSTINLRSDDLFPSKKSG